MKHKKLTLLLLIVCFFQLTGFAQGSYFQQEVHYTIDVTLSEPQHTLDGFVRMQYRNNSPDTLTYLWIHCWPNAYKNDRTAFSEQLLDNRRTDFYFGDKAQRGYINRLAFRVDGEEARMEDHPQYIDIIRIDLPKPLPPASRITLSTPFHVQLPHGYQVEYWYPQPAVYDNHGWHPMPYLEQSGSYSEFGSYDVHITVPAGFNIAATGQLQDSSDHTYHYTQDHVRDFFWVAGRNIHLAHDTLHLPSGRIIDVYAPKPNIPNVKHAITLYSNLIGEYPYTTMTIMGNQPPEQEVAQYWFSAIIGSNERRYPWMDHGFSTYYENRYHHTRPDSTKAAIWLKMLEDSLGTPLFDSCMRDYYRTWQFKHPAPEDFKNIVTTTTHRDLDNFFALLDKKGPLPPPPAHRTLKLAFGWNLHHTDSIQYLSLAPAAGFNDYDHFMIGLLIHNFNLSPNPFQFYLAPLYGTESHHLDGAGGLYYTKHNIRLGVDLARFSTTSALDSNGHRLFGGFHKVTPGIKILFPKTSERSTVEKALEWKTYLIGENMLDHYVQKSSNSSYYPTAGSYSFRYLNQLSFDIHDTRVLYPYKAILQVQQASNFYRINFTGNYFFNYAKGGGLDLRLFGAKFGYLASGETSSDITRYEPKLTAVRGDEDYTYSNYFIGRSEFTGLASQQIMNRDGDLPIRTDLFQGLQGRSANWIASLNLRTTLPHAIVPQWLPLKLFFDVGTYAEAWGENPPTNHFLYVGGFELDLFHDVFHIYAPIVYSTDFSNQLKTVPDQNSFGKRISFSIDIGNIDFRKLIVGQ